MRTLFLRDWTEWRRLADSLQLEVPLLQDPIYTWAGVWDEPRRTKECQGEHVLRSVKGGSRKKTWFNTMKISIIMQKKSKRNFCKSYTKSPCYKLYHILFFWFSGSSLIWVWQCYHLQGVARFDNNRLTLTARDQATIKGFTNTLHFTQYGATEVIRNLDFNWYSTDFYQTLASVSGEVISTKIYKKL